MPKGIQDLVPADVATGILMQQAGCQLLDDEDVVDGGGGCSCSCLLCPMVTWVPLPHFGAMMSTKLAGSTDPMMLLLAD